MYHTVLKLQQWDGSFLRTHPDAMALFGTLFQPLLLSLFLYIAYKTIGHLLRNSLRAKLTAVDDLPLLLNVRNDEDKIQGTAVICGGRFES